MTRLTSMKSSVKLLVGAVALVAPLLAGWAMTDFDIGDNSGAETYDILSLISDDGNEYTIERLVVAGEMDLDVTGPNGELVSEYPEDVADLVDELSDPGWEPPKTNTWSEADGVPCYNAEVVAGFVEGDGETSTGRVLDGFGEMTAAVELRSGELSAVYFEGIPFTHEELAAHVDAGGSLADLEGAQEMNACS